MPADTALSLALSPLLLAQALHVRRKALRLPEPPGPRHGTAHAAQSGAPLRLLILGDSSAAGVGASHQSRALSGQLAARLARRHALSWRLEASTGATSASARARLAALAPAPFDVAIVVLGVNDVTGMVSPRRFVALRRAIHADLRTRFAVSRIIASGLPPMGQFPLLPQPLRAVLGSAATRLDSALAALCAQQAGCTHLPLTLPFAPEFVATDGFHPSETAYARWAEMLAALI